MPVRVEVSTCAYQQSGSRDYSGRLAVLRTPLALQFWASGGQYTAILCLHYHIILIVVAVGGDADVAYASRGRNDAVGYPCVPYK
jgi:hypothetical protein